jgi:hypothetical protein
MQKKLFIEILNRQIRLERLAKIYNFKIKKMIQDINGGIIEIDNQYEFLLRSNKNIKVYEMDELYSNVDLIKTFDYNTYKLLTRFKSF